MDNKVIESIAAITAHVTTVLAALAAAWWFFVTDSFRKKIQFNVQCAAFNNSSFKDRKLVELAFLLENKGQVSNRCYTLAYEVWSVGATSELLDRSGNLVPKSAEYYYVRAGVTLRITARLSIPSNVSTLRVRAFILYDKHRNELDNTSDLFAQMYAHHDWTALDRVFSVVGDSSVMPTGPLAPANTNTATAS